MSQLDDEPTARDREVSEMCRNSSSRAERDAIVASYRVELLARIRERIERNFVHTRDSLRELMEGL
jgi:hypothetical protein